MTGPLDAGRESTARSTGPVVVGAPSAAETQGSLFPDSDVRPLTEELGYRGQVARAAADITYRQLDYWARTELVVPSIRPAAGSGSQRLYSFRDILILRIVKRLLDTGISLQNVRTAVQHLGQRGVTDLSQITLMSDGASIYECRDNDEIIDLLNGGQCVFGIGIGSVWREVEGSLSHLPGERIDDGTTVAATPDELAARRSRKIS